MFHLFVDGEPLVSVELVQLLRDERIRSTANQFLAKGTRHLEGDFHGKSVYVYQKEWAIVESGGRVQYLGSQDATTCIIVLLRGQSLVHGKEINFCVHFDGKEGQEMEMKRVVERVYLGQEECAHNADLAKEVDGDNDIVELETHLIGGYHDLDGKNLSHDQCQTVLNMLATEIGDGRIHFLLRTCCIEMLNTEDRDIVMTHSASHLGGRHGKSVRCTVKAPVATGVAMDIESGEVFPAIMKDEGPELSLRSVCSFMSDELLLNTYDHEHDRYVVNRVEFNPIPPDVCKSLLTMPDDVLLEHMSTSPLVEPEGFPARMRETLQCMLRNPNGPDDIFDNGSPVIFRRTTEKEQLEKLRSNNVDHTSPDWTFYWMREN